MAEDPKAIAVGEKLRRYWDQSIFFLTMGSYPISGLCSKRSPWSSTTTLAGAASGGASWQFQELKDFGHDGHNTDITLLSILHQFRGSLSYVYPMFLPRTPTGKRVSSYIFSLCRLLSINRVSQHHVFCPSLLPSLLPSSIPSFTGFIFFDASP